MNKKIFTSLSLVLLLFGFFILPAYAEQPKPIEQVKQVQLTESQKAELAEIYKDILDERKELIQKYVEFGVISKEKGNEMIKRFEEHFKIMEQNGFMFPHHPHKVPHH